MRSWAAWLLAPLALACGADPAFELPASAPAALVVRNGSLEQRVLLTGELSAADSDELTVPRTESWQVSIRWIAPDGAELAAGDKLLELDNVAVVQKLNELELAVIRADNALASQAASDASEIATKELAVERERVAMAKAELDTEIPAPLLARRRWQDYQLALERARVAHTTAKDELAAARAAAVEEQRVKRIDLDNAKRALRKAEEQLELLVLRAPRAGVFVVGTHPWFGRKFQVGDVVRPGLVVGEVTGGAALEVEAVVSDVDDGRVAVGMSARCILDAYPERAFSGRVASLSAVAREPEEGSLRRFFSAVIALENAEPSIMRPGMSVRVEVVAHARADAVIAPRAGLDLSVAPPRARLADGSEREIEIELCTPQACAVSAGLAPGERLLATGGAR